MIKISAVMAVCVILAYYSEKQTKAIQIQGHRYSVWNDPAYLALAVILVLFAGLRTGYNDTWNYINSFRNSEGLAAFLTNPENLNLFKNPLFYFSFSALRDVTGNAQWLVFTTSVLTQLSFLLFFKRYSHNFTFSVFIFFTLGTFNVSLAAMKQVCAMAIVMLAFPCLEKKQWGRYYAAVFIAMLVHTYALAYAVLPLFRKRPWQLFTYLFVAAVAILMMNFQEAISAFMDQADELGKTLYEEEIFDENTTNLFRLAVYAVTPLISLLFSKWVFRKSSTMDHVLVHMSIISFAFMCYPSNYLRPGSSDYLWEMRHNQCGQKTVCNFICGCKVALFMVLQERNRDHQNATRDSHRTPRCLLTGRSRRLRSLFGHL